MLEAEEFWTVIALCSLPFLAFGGIELLAFRRRKRAEAIARRRKDIPEKMARRR